MERSPGYLPGRLKEREAQPPQRPCTRPLEGNGAARESRQGRQWKLGRGPRRLHAMTPAHQQRAEGYPPDAPMHRRTALLMCPRWRGATATETLFDSGPQVLELYISHLKGPKGFERLLLHVGRKIARLGHKREARAALSEAGPSQAQIQNGGQPHAPSDRR